MILPRFESPMIKMEFFNSGRIQSVFWGDFPLDRFECTFGVIATLLLFLGDEMRDFFSAMDVSEVDSGERGRFLLKVWGLEVSSYVLLGLLCGESLIGLEALAAYEVVG